MQPAARHIFLVLVLLAAFAPRLTAQTDPLLSQHYAVPTLYNPAMAGSTDLLRIRAGGRLQWLGIDNAPTSFLGTADMPLNLFGKRFGVGAVFMQESMGLYSNLALGAQISYKFRKLGGEFSVGVQFGMYDMGFKGSEVILPDDDDFHEGADDGLPTSDVHGTAFDMAAGVAYTHKYFSAGVGCTHIMSPTVSLTADAAGGGMSRASDGGSASGERLFEYRAGRTLYFQAEGNIPVRNTLFDILPAVLVASDFTNTSAVVNARARYRKFLSFGVGYRWGDAVIATLSAEFKNFFIGYSFDYSTSAIAKASSGSHELFVGYSLRIDTGAKNKNKHKSIRIM